MTAAMGANSLSPAPLDTKDSLTPPPSAGPSRPSTPATIHSAAQRGDNALITHLISTSRATANDRDEDRITPLHWAAINAHASTCRLLIEMGAEVDAIGGDLEASPLQWAARNGHLYVMHTLLQLGADPSLTDAQGFNTLHLTVHSSAVMPLVLLLQHPAFAAVSSLDSPDSQGHTPLMWAAYQGDAISVDLLLAHGADVHNKDAVGLSPMHWAVVKGNRLCIRKLASAGSDLWAKEQDGKTPRDMAVELKSIAAYSKALADVGFEEDGRRKTRPIGEYPARICILLTPFFSFGLIFSTLNILPWFTGMPLAIGEFFAMHHVITRVLLDPLELESLQKSNYFLAVVSGSIAWVGWEWVSKLVAATPGFAIWNLTFAIAILVASWNLFRATTLEPGYAPRSQTETDRRATVDFLVNDGRLNGMNYCVVCMARRPLRSKHCRHCNRCVARHDHHCPWVNNCIGVNNHRQFIVFITSLVVGIVCFDYLVYQYYVLNTPPYIPAVTSSCLLPASICASTDFDTFLFSCMLWSTLQLTWTSVLLVAHTWQISRQMTTLEVSNLGRYGYMGGKGGSSMTSQSGFMEARATALRNSGVPVERNGFVQQSDAAGMEEEGQAGTKSTHHHGTLTGFMGGTGNWLLSIVGLDLYTKGKGGEGLKKASRSQNPFDQGPFINCQDFWTRGRVLSVKYEELYDVPPGGFKPNSLGSSSSHRYDSDLEVGAGNGDRRWSMWTSVRGALPRRHHNYALVPGDQHESINGGA
jgi:ankyrin repeat protein